MKISLNCKFREGPYGGGMQFANFLRNFITQRGHTVVNDLVDEDIDLILHINPFPHLTPEISAYSFEDAAKYKRKHPNVVIIERINECDERKGTRHMNRLLVEAVKKSDFVVFIASWLRPLMLKSGMMEDKPYRVILNGADSSIFNTVGKTYWDGVEKLKIVTHHWSDNSRKGHTLYKQLDELISTELGEKIEFTYIGRIPPELKYKNTNIISSLSGRELASELRKHHVYITASENEPAGMHHIEGALSGLPILYINSGALPEYCEGFGLEFDSNNLEEKISEMRERYGEFTERLKSYNNTAEKMAHQYLKLFEELTSTRKTIAAKTWKNRLKKFIPQPLKCPIIAFYVFSRCILRGIPSKNPALNLAGVLPSPGQIVHGGKVKLLHLRERFGDTWKKFNLAYFVSSGLPFAPGVWIRIYKLFGIKTVWNQNGVYYPAIGPEDMVKRVNGSMISIHNADYVVFQTEFTKKCSDKFLGEYKGEHSVLINPVDTTRFKPREIPLSLEPFTIIMSGHHFESKERLNVSLEAVRLLKENDHNVKLIIIANNQEFEEEDWMDVRGKFTQDEAPRLYNEAHVFLHLKSLDPCPTLVLEALSSGLPVVGLKNGGMPELVDEKSGVLIDAPEDFNRFQYPSSDTVANAILRVRSELVSLSKGARERALQFDKEIWLKKHEEIFNRLCRKSQ